MDNVSAEVQETRGKFRGEVVYIYAFDLAYDMKREPIRQLLGQKVGEYAIGPDKRSPKQVFFYQPQTVTLPVEERQLHGKPVEIRKSIKIFSVGAISFLVRIPFEVERFEELVRYHDLTFSDKNLAGIIHEIAQKVRDELAAYCIRPVEQLGSADAYTVFCMYGLPKDAGSDGKQAENWFMANRQKVAALLMQEENPRQLSKQEVMESTEHYVTYYENDLIIVDWDAALVINEPEGLNDILHIMELANVQLVELAAYDRILDNSLELAYRDLAQRRSRGRGDVHRKLREIRIDMTRLNDELVNITKFFGDWYLATVYQKAFERFHLADWKKIIDDKLKTLGELYQLLQQDWVNLWMMILEATIVLLFIIDLVLLLAK